ncbi:MAG: hypothetical protein V4621_04215 [Pseudomonadota bacterium]
MPTATFHPVSEALEQEVTKPESCKGQFREAALAVINSDRDPKVFRIMIAAGARLPSTSAVAALAAFAVVEYEDYAKRHMSQYGLARVIHAAEVTAQPELWALAITESMRTYAKGEGISRPEDDMLDMYYHNLVGATYLLPEEQRISSMTATYNILFSSVDSKSDFEDTITRQTDDLATDIIEAIDSLTYEHQVKIYSEVCTCLVVCTRHDSVALSPLYQRARESLAALKATQPLDLDGFAKKHKLEL